MERYTWRDLFRDVRATLIFPGVVMLAAIVSIVLGGEWFLFRLLMMGLIGAAFLFTAIVFERIDWIRYPALAFTLISFGLAVMMFFGNLPKYSVEE